MRSQFQVGDRVRLNLPGANIDAMVTAVSCQSPCFYTLDCGAGDLLQVRESDLAPAGEIVDQSQVAPEF